MKTFLAILGRTLLVAVFPACLAGGIASGYRVAQTSAAEEAQKVAQTHKNALDASHGRGYLQGLHKGFAYGIAEGVAIERRETYKGCGPLHHVKEDI